MDTYVYMGLNKGILGYHLNPNPNITPNSEESPGESHGSSYSVVVYRGSGFVSEGLGV